MGFLKNGYKTIFNKGNREMTASKTNLPVEDAQALVFFDVEGEEPVDTDSVKFVYTKGTDIYVSEKNIPTDNDIKVLVGDPTTAEVVIGNMPVNVIFTVDEKYGSTYVEYEWSPKKEGDEQVWGVLTTVMRNSGDVINLELTASSGYFDTESEFWAPKMDGKPIELVDNKFTVTYTVPEDAAEEITVEFTGIAIGGVE